MFHQFTLASVSLKLPVGFTHLQIDFTVLLIWGVSSVSVALFSRAELQNLAQLQKKFRFEHTSKGQRYLRALPT